MVMEREDRCMEEKTRNCLCIQHFFLFNSSCSVEGTELERVDERRKRRRIRKALIALKRIDLSDQLLDDPSALTQEGKNR